MMNEISMTVAVADINPLDAILKVFIHTKTTTVITDMTLSTKALPYIIISLNPERLFWRIEFESEIPRLIDDAYQLSETGNYRTYRLMLKRGRK